MEVGLSLGSSLGDRLASLKKARELICAYPGITLAAQAPVYETEPVNLPPEFKDHLFLNTILIINTLVSVPQIMRLLQFIEQQMGRAPELGADLPRVIDIDIVFADQLQVEEEHIVIPHPRWHTRRFVLQPLCDVRPELILPGQTLPVADILAALRNGHKVQLFAKKW